MRLAIGRESDTERAQIINEDGWHVATVEHDPAIEIANKLVVAYNSHDALVAACEWAREALDDDAANRRVVNALGFALANAKI